MEIRGIHAPRMMRRAAWGFANLVALCGKLRRAGV
jgi:hypothetical protein